jgi:hypothetical protein
VSLEKNFGYAEKQIQHGRISQPDATDVLPCLQRHLLKDPLPGTEPVSERYRGSREHCGVEKMSRGMPSMTALLGLLAIAGYQNRDKLAEMLNRATSGEQQPALG